MLTVEVNADIGYDGAMSKPAQHTSAKLVRMSPELISAIAAWRRQQEPIPSEAEAIRRLIEAGLAAQPAEKPVEPNK